VDGRALIDIQLEALAAVGVDDVTVVAGFMSDDVVRHVDGRCRVVVNDRYATTNSIASLHLAGTHLRNNAFLLQNADVLYSVEMLRRMVTDREENTCLVDPFLPFSSGEYAVELADGRIVQYSRTVHPERSVGVSAQLLRVCASDSAAFLDRVAGLVSSGNVHAFPNQAYDVLMSGRGLRPAFTAGLPWWEIDTPEDLARCSNARTAAAQALSEPPFAASSPPIGARIANFAKAPHLPWSLHWLPATTDALVRHPIDTCRSIRSYNHGELSFRALDLAANGRRFLRIVLAEAEECGIQPFLVWGTLLGCVRDGGFIQGDHDIDLGVRASDADRLPMLRERMKRRGFDVRIENDDKLSLVHARHPSLYIDIDVVRPHRDGWAITNRDADSTRTFRYHFAAPVFAGMRHVQFADGLTVRIPEDSHGFLEAAYGDWRVPGGKVDYRYGPLNTEVDLVAQAGIRLPDNSQPSGARGMPFAVQ
jgi:choline kinase